MSERPRVPLVSFFSANACFGSGLFFHSFLYNYYLEALGHSESTMGLAAASLTAGSFAALFPAGVAADRVGPDRAFRLAAVTAAVGLAAGALLERPGAIYAAAFLAGFGTAAWRVSMGPILMSLAPARARRRLFSWNVALLVASGGVWTALSGTVTEVLQQDMGLRRMDALRVALLLGAGATAAAAALFGRNRPTPSGRGGLIGGQVAAALRDAVRLPPQFGRAIVAVAIWMIAPALVLPFFNLFFLREFGLSVQRIGVVFGLVHIATALAVFGSGEAAARLGPRPVLVAWMLILAPALWALSAVSAVGHAVALYLVQGFVSPATNPLLDQLLLEAAPHSKVGVVSSWRNAATEVGGSVGASLGGVILDSQSFDALFVAAGSLGLVAAGAVAWAVRSLSAKVGQGFDGLEHEKA